MSNTDIRLPTSGSLNWGGGLNRYLENLNSEILNLQKLVAQKKENYHLVGYAGSGMVGECDIEYSTSSHKVSFSGNVYLSGEHAYYKEDLEVESSELSETSYPVFVFLLAEVATSGEDQGEYTWRIVTDDSFQIDYHYILLGLFYRFTVSSASGNKIIENFIPYYFSSAKTLAQHRHELIQRWADLNRNLTSLTVTIKDKIPSILSTDLDWDGDFDLYCGGLGHDNEQSTVLSPAGKYTVARSHFVTKSGVKTLEKKNINVILFQDKVEGEEGKIVTSKLESWNINDFNDDKTVYFRILLDIFGNIIIQKSLDDLIFPSAQRQWSEQQLYNARFASLESSIVSGASGFSWEAGLPIEVARFGYNCADISDTTYKQNDHTPGLANFYFVKSLDAGVAYQQAQNIYITQDSEIWLDKVSFKKTGSDPNSFVMDYKGGEYLYKSYTNKITSTTSSFYVSTTLPPDKDDQVASSDWRQDITYYVEEIGWYEVESGSENVIKYFKTKKAFDKIKFGRGDVEKEEKTVYELLEEQKGSEYNFIPLKIEGGKSLALCVTFKENIYTVSLGVGTSTNSFSTNWEDVKSQLTAEEFYITTTPAVEFNTIYFDFTTSESGLSKVLWTKTNTRESIEMSSNGISLISSNDIGLTSSNDINLKSSKYINLTSDNNINLTSDNYGINLTSNNDINLSSQANIVIATEKEFILATSEDKFTIALEDDVPLNITTSKLSLSNDLYVKNELRFDTGGFITLPSDRRLKTNIENINHSFLNVVNQTPILSFKYKGGRDTFVGLMAQDLRNSLPEEFKNIFVKTHETEEYKDQLCIAETKLVYVLWKALQEEIKNRNKLEEEICEIKKYLSL